MKILQWLAGVLVVGLVFAMVCVVGCYNDVTQSAADRAEECFKLQERILQEGEDSYASRLALHNLVWAQSFVRTELSAADEKLFQKVLGRAKEWAEKAELPPVRMGVPPVSSGSSGQIRPMFPGGSKSKIEIPKTPFDYARELNTDQ